MALTDDNSMVMPVQPMYGGYGNGGGFGMGGDWAWILLLLILGGNGFGWGMGGFGGMMGAGMMGLGYDFPWLLAGQTNTDNNVSSGFRDAQIHDSITSVRDGISALATQLCQCCSDMRYDMANGLNGVNQNVSNGFANTNLALANGFAGVNSNLCNGFNGVNSAIFGAQTAIGQQLNANEMANLNRSFAEQTANAQGFNAVNAGIADTRYTIAQEACATRQTDTQNTQNILNVINGGIQSIKDQLCQDKIDAKNDEIAQLRQEVLYARGQASQVDQTAQILANNNAQTALFQQGLNNEVDALYTRLQNCPVNTVPVYGNQRIFTCPQQHNPGCGCNGGNFQ